MEKLIFPAFGKILVLVNAFSIQILIKKYWKIDFCSFWQDLGFGECFFLFKFQLNSIQKWIFSVFGKILVLANAFFYSNSNLKSIEKLIKILVLVNAFFYSNSN